MAAHETEAGSLSHTRAPTAGFRAVGAMADE